MSVSEDERRKRIREAAARALSEAKAREHAREPMAPVRETGGRAGPEPTRYGDWEKGGLAIDF